jgi:hypothetical protein
MNSLLDVFVHPPRTNEALKGRKIDRATLGRSWSFAKPYRRQLATYLAVTVVGTFFGVIPAFLFRDIIDGAIPAENKGRVGVLVLAMVVVAGASSRAGPVPHLAKGSSLICALHCFNTSAGCRFLSSHAPRPVR